MQADIEIKEGLLDDIEATQKEVVATKEFGTSLETIDSALEWYESICKELFGCSEEAIARAGMVFSELYLNAYEHGNLALDTQTKMEYIQKDEYFKKLKELERRFGHRNISVVIARVSDAKGEYAATQICDEGEGFDVEQICDLHKSTTNLNGRGIYMSRQNCCNLHYNKKGNCVLYLYPLSKERE